MEFQYLPKLTTDNMNSIFYIKVRDTQAPSFAHVQYITNYF
jgi:hypothetical protein